MLRRTAILLSIVGAMLAPGVRAEPRPDARRAIAAARALEQRLELSRGKRFYLLLDLDSSTLSLRLGGALLDEMPVHALEIGVPRVLFVRRGRPLAWQARTFTAGELVPSRERERVEIVAQPVTEDGGGGEEPEEVGVPAPPEELYDVPSRFLVRFTEGLTLEVRPRGASTSLLARLGDAVAALRPTLPEKLRVRVEVSPEDYDGLYRSLPPEVALLALPRSR